MSTFKELINADKPVLVDFHAEWCGPCKQMKPILEDLKTRVGEEVTIIKIDIDKSPNTAKHYQIQGVPTLILFKQGKILWRQSGVVPVNALQKVLKENL